MKLDETGTYFSLEDVSFSESIPMQFVSAQWLWLESCTWSKHGPSLEAVGTAALAGSRVGAGGTWSKADVTWGFSSGAMEVTALVKAGINAGRAGALVQSAPL